MNNQLVISVRPLGRRWPGLAVGKPWHSWYWQLGVFSKDELKERILRGISEMNAAPVVYRWKKFDLEMEIA